MEPSASKIAPRMMGLVGIERMHIGDMIGDMDTHGYRMSTIFSNTYFQKQPYSAVFADLRSLWASKNPLEFSR